MIFEATDKAITYDDKAGRFRVTGFLRDLPDGGPGRGAVNWALPGKAILSTNVRRRPSL